MMYILKVQGQEISAMIIQPMSNIIMRAEDYYSL